jgi:peptidoglycan/LPS O-acetylase OafA/YrhL
VSATAATTGRRTHGHFPGLDGLRGLAVLAVVLYHGGLSWAQGGFLGVEAFFVLSGFLITSLLVSEWGSSNSIELRAFWARRARRLLPALLVLVSVIGIYYAFAGPTQAVPDLKGDGLSTLLYAGNWHEISTG